MVRVLLLGGAVMVWLGLLVGGGGVVAERVAVVGRRMLDGCVVVGSGLKG